jgi:hypothetical protein
MNDVPPPLGSERYVRIVSFRPKGVEPPGPRISAAPFVWRDPATIPPREWLYGRHYIRKYVSATVAPGGLGKSSLGIAEGLAMASGQDLLGCATPRQLRVWYYNLEDPIDEIERRIAAGMIYYKLAPAAIEGRLFVNSGRDTQLIIGEKVRDSVVIFHPIAAALMEQIRARAIDVLILDPFVSCHRMPENDNGGIDAVAKAWAHIADATAARLSLSIMCESLVAALRSSQLMMHVVRVLS